MFWYWIVYVSTVLVLLMVIGALRQALRRGQPQTRQSLDHEKRIHELARQCALVTNDLRNKKCELHIAHEHIERLSRQAFDQQRLFHDIFQSGKYRGKIEIVTTLVGHLVHCRSYHIDSDEVLDELEIAMHRILDAETVEVLINSLPPRTGNSSANQPT